MFQLRMSVTVRTCYLFWTRTSVTVRIWHLFQLCKSVTLKIWRSLFILASQFGNYQNLTFVSDLHQNVMFTFVLSVNVRMYHLSVVSTSIPVTVIFWHFFRNRKSIAVKIKMVVCHLFQLCTSLTVIICFSHIGNNQNLTFDIYFSFARQ